jgi:hypothetical protein
MSRVIYFYSDFVMSSMGSGLVLILVLLPFSVYAACVDDVIMVPVRNILRPAQNPGSLALIFTSTLYKPIPVFPGCSPRVM